LVLFLFEFLFFNRLFVAGNLCLNENDKLTLWDSTMMPNIPGMPAIICLIFSPCVEIRYTFLKIKIIVYVLYSFFILFLDTILLILK